MEHLANTDIGIELLYRDENINTVPFSDITDYNKFCEELDLLPLRTIPYTTVISVHNRHNA